MKTKTESTARSFTRSIAMGVLLSMLFFFGIHVFGEWWFENYQPDPETTSSVLLHNKCLVFGITHTLRPNTDVSGMSNGVNGTKLSGSFMNFFDGHIAAMIIIAIVLGVLIFFIRSRSRKSQS